MNAVQPVHYLYRKLAGAVFWASLLLAILSSAAFFGIELHRSNAKAEVMLNQLLDTVEQAAAIAAYIDQPDMGEGVLARLLHNDAIHTARLSNGRHLDLRKSRTPAAVRAGEVVRALRTPVDRAEIVGQLAVVPDPHYILREALSIAALAALQSSTLIGLTALIVLYIVRASLSRPLRIVSDTLHAIAAGEREILEPLPQHRDDELGRLVEDTNALLERLRERSREQQALLSFALDHVHEAAFLTDEHARFHYVNEESCRALGYSREELLGLSVMDIDPWRPPQEWPKRWQHIRTAGTYTVESRHKTKDGRIFPVEVTANYIEYEGRAYNLALVRDITERKQSEQALREREEYFRRLVEESPVAMVITSGPEERVELFNRKFTDLFGYTIEDVPDIAHWWPLAYPDESYRGEVQAQWRAVVERAAQDGGETQPMEAAVACKDGSRCIIEFRGCAIGARNIVTFIDLTERKRAEEQRQAYLRFLESMDLVNQAIQQGGQDIERMLGDVLDVALAIFDCDRVFLLHPCDPEAASWQVPVERARPEYPGVFAQGLKMPMDADVARTLRELLASDGPVRFGPGGGFPLPKDVAQRFSIQSFMSVAIRPKLGKPWQFGMHQCSYPRVWTPEEERLLQEIGWRLTDALSSLLAYRNLEDSEAKLAQAQRIAHVGWWDRDYRAGRITLSDESCRIFGLPLEERVADLAKWHERWLTLIHPDDRLKVSQAGAEAIRGGPRYDVEYRVVRPSGEVRFVHSVADMTRDESGQPLRWFGMMQDITALRQAEHELRASEARFRTFVDHATDAFFLQDEQGIVVDVNRQACESLGRTREELIGKHPSEFDAGIDPTHMEEVNARLNAGEVFAFDSRHRRKDGTAFPVEIRVRPFWQDGRRFGVALVRDITERKRVEQELKALNATLERRVQEELASNREKDHLLIQQSRLAAMGEMVHNIAHQWRQPLSALGIVIHNIKDDYDYGELTEARLNEAVEKSHRLLQRMSSTVDDFRNFFRPDRETTDFSLESCVEDALFIIADSLRNNGIVVETRLEKGLRAHGHPNQCAQAILNLLANAKEVLLERKIMDGRIGIELERRNGEAILTVQDNAGGIAEAVLPRVFEPYFTTKEQGSGIGLYMTRTIVEHNLRGRIGATNRDGGALFTLSIPLSEREPGG